MRKACNYSFEESTACRPLFMGKHTKVADLISMNLPQLLQQQRKTSCLLRQVVDESGHNAADGQELAAVIRQARELFRAPQRTVTVQGFMNCLIETINIAKAIVDCRRAGSCIFSNDTSR